MLAIFLMESFPAKPSLFSCERAQRKKIQVMVSGAVERPGLYEVDVGASVKSVLEQAGLQRVADRRALYLKKQLLNSCHLTVPKKKCKKEKKRKQVSSSMSLASYAIQDSKGPSNAEALNRFLNF